MQGSEQLEIIESAGGVELTVKVVPGASRTAIAGTWGKALKIAIAAPPEGGRANAALVRFLAGVLGVRRSEVAIVHGQTQPLKRVRVQKLRAAEVRGRLAGN